MQKRIGIWIVLVVFFLVSGYVSAATFGRPYEQRTDLSNKQMPTLSLIGTKSITSNQKATFSARATYCSTCTPFYYWEASEGSFTGDSSKANVIWTPPSVTSTRTFQILATVGDGKGNIASASYPVTVTPAGTTTTTTPPVVEVGSTNPSGQLNASYNQSESTFYLNYSVNEYTDEIKIYSSLDGGSSWNMVFNRYVAGLRSGNQPVSISAANSYTSIKFKLEAIKASGNIIAATPVYTLNYTPPAAYVQKSSEPPGIPVLYSLGISTVVNWVDVSWSKINDSHYNDNVNYYEIQYANNSSFSGASTINIGNPVANTNMYESVTYRVSGLTDSTHYYFRARATNNLGTSSWSAPASIKVDFQNKPYFDTAYQIPANNATGVSKTPVLRWRALDADNDRLDYYIAYGKSPTALDRTLRAFSSSNHSFQDYFDFAFEYSGQLEPNTTYYWQIWVREDGYFRDYYGGEYIKSPVWSFKTVATGSDPEIVSVQQIGTLAPATKVTYRLTLRNNGTEKSISNVIKADYLKANKNTPFWTVENPVVPELNPGETRTLDVVVQFRESIWNSNGVEYDNVLVSGGSNIRFRLFYDDPQDINKSNNQTTLAINYVDAGGPVISSFDLREHGSMYSNWGIPFWARVGNKLTIVANAKDDVKSTRGVIQYRLHAADAWTTIFDGGNSGSSDYFLFPDCQNCYQWEIPAGTMSTTEAQIRVMFYDDKNNETIKVSDPFTIYSNRIDATISAASALFNTGGTLTYNVTASSDNPIGNINARLLYGAGIEIVKDLSSTTGLTVGPQYTWSIPNNNYYASKNCYLELTLTDIRGSSKKILSPMFAIEPNTDLPSPFNAAVNIYNEEFSFPTDALYKQQGKDVLFVKLDSANLAHAVVQHSYKYYRNNAQMENEDFYEYVDNKYYITYKKSTNTVSSKLLIADKTYSVVAFDVVNDIPYAILRSADNRERYFYTYKSGTSFVAPVPIENNTVPSISTVTKVATPSNISLSNPNAYTLVNGYLWELSITGTSVERYSFSGGNVGGRETVNIQYNGGGSSYWIRPVVDGGVIYFVSHSDSKLVKFDTVNLVSTAYALPFTVGSDQSQAGKVALAAKDGKAFVFGNGRVYALEGGSVVDKGPIAYTFGTNTVDYSSTWSNIRYIRSVMTETEVVLILGEDLWSTAKPVGSPYEILKFNVSSNTFSKTIAQSRRNSPLNGTCDDLSCNNVSYFDIQYIGNNKVLTAFTSGGMGLSNLYTYRAYLKMLDLTTGDVVTLGAVPLKSQNWVSIINNGGALYLLANNSPSYTAESYSLSLSNITSSPIQVENMRLVNRAGSLYAVWNGGVAYDGTWNTSQNTLNNYVIRKNKYLKLYPLVGSIANVSNDYLGGWFNSVGGYLTTDERDVYSLGSDLTTNQRLYDCPNCSGNPVVINSFGSAYIGGYESFQNGKPRMGLYKSDLTTFETEMPSQSNKIAGFSDGIITGGSGLDSYNGRNVISYINPTDGSKSIVAFGTANSNNTFDRIDINQNRYVAVGWSNFIAVADFSGDIVPPNVSILGKGSAAISASGGSTVTINWSTSDNNGQISKVEVYKVVNGVATLLTTITNPTKTSYQYTFGANEQGQVDFRIVAYDANNNTKFDTISYSVTSQLVLDSFTVDKTTIDLGSSLLFSWSSHGGETLYNRYNVFYKRESDSYRTVSSFGTNGDKAVVADFDGDGKSDIAVWRSTNGNWLVNQSGSNFTNVMTKSQGGSTDVPLAGDFDGDGKADLMTWSGSSGTWSIKLASSSFNTEVTYSHGVAGDVPLVGDVDGDGKVDLIAWRLSTATFYIRKTANGGISSVQFPSASQSDIPFVTDFDGDGKADVGLWRSATGNWEVKKSSDGATIAAQLGSAAAGDTPMAIDFDGDGKADMVIWNATSGTWTALTAASNYASTATASWGGAGDVPMPGNYSGNGKFEPAVFRPATGSWLIQNPWSKLFSEAGDITSKQVTMDTLLGSHLFKMEAGQDTRTITTPVVINGYVFSFNNAAFVPLNTVTVGESRQLVFGWESNLPSGSFAIFRVLVKTDKDVDYVDLGTVLTNSFSYTVPGGVGAFDWKVVVSYGNSQYTSQVNHVVLQTPSSPAITKLSVNANFSVTVEFPTVSGVTEYAVLRKDSNGSVTQAGVVQRGTFNDTSVMYGEKYSYAIASRYDGKNVGAGAYSDITVLLPAIDSINIGQPVITANAVSVQLTSSPANAYARFEIRFGSDPSNLPLAFMTTQSTLSFDQLNFNTAYYLEVYPVDYLGTRTSNIPAKKTIVIGLDPRVISTAPMVTAKQLDGNWVLLEWNAINYANRYAVYRSSDGNTYESLGETFDTAYYDSIAGLGTNLYYKVAALNDNTSKFSTGLSLTVTGPVLLLDKNALAFGNQNIGVVSTAQTLTLSNSGTATLSITGISITGDFAQSSTCGTALAAGAACSVAITLTPTAAGARIGTLSIQTNAAGSPHMVSLEGTGGTFAAPGTPSAVSATPGNALAIFTFAAPSSNGGSAITGYNVTCNPGAIVATGTVSPISVTGLTNGTTYSCSVTATNIIGTGAASTAVSVVPRTVPGAPTGVSAIAGNTSASISFTVPTSNGGGVITGYTVTSSPGNVTATGSTSPITVRNLTNNTSYTFTVVATNAAGNSVASVASNSVIPSSDSSLPGTPVCSLKANPASIAVGGSATLTATCNPAASSYTWSGGTCAGTTGATCTVMPTVTTTYSVKGTNATGSGQAATAIVTVSSIPATTYFGQWSFDACDGSDSSGNGRTAVLQGTTCVDGHSGKALYFQNSANAGWFDKKDWVVLPNFTGKAVSFRAWVKWMKANNFDVGAAIWSIGDGSSSSFVALFVDSNAGKIWLNNQNINSATADISDGNWHLVEVAVGSTSGTLSLDGQLVGTATAPNALNLVNAPHYLSYSQWYNGGAGSSRFYGYLDEVSVGTGQPATIPVCTLSANPPSITAGGSSTLTAICSPTASSYTWSDGSCASTSATCTVRPTATTTYKVTGTNSAGTGAVDSATVTVNAACNPTLGSTNASVAATASTGSISVTSSCAWTATSNASWITITSGASGSGNGTVAYAVAANTDTTTRTGTLTIAGQTFTVTQATGSTVTAPRCTLTVSPSSIVAGGSSILTVTCNPAATSYIWTGASCSSTSATCTVRPTVTTTYSVQGSNAGGTNQAISGTVTVTAANIPSYTVPGTLGNDVFVLTAGNSYYGGAGNDTYIISSRTLSGAVTAKIIDTEGDNLIQLVDGVIVAGSTLHSDAAQLTLSTGAKVQILGASKFKFQVGANAPAGDTATVLSYADFVSILGASLTSGTLPASGTAGYVVPTGFTQASAPVPSVAGTSYTVPGTLGDDVFVLSAGNSYLGGGGNDTYIISPYTLSGAVTAKIIDSEGANVIQLVKGLTVASSSFFSNAVQLTLSNGAKVQILGASSFSYQLGANAPAGETASSLSYAQFAAALGASVPTGTSAVSGSTDFVVP